MTSKEKIKCTRPKKGKKDVPIPIKNKPIGCSWEFNLDNS
jgi:hypothetical protein